MEDAFINALQILSQMLYKIIEVNLEDGSYFEIKNDGNGKKYYDVLYWAQEFAKENVYPMDKEKFMRFFNPFSMRRHEKEWQKVYYRRLIGKKWRWVCMEVIPENDDIVLIVVRDVDDYIEQWRKEF